MDYFGIRPHQAGVGNVYYVIQSGDTGYALLEDHLEKTYRDGSSAVQTTISAALTATVTNRNDYVIVMPDNDDYDQTATLTMDKNAVHVISPAGVGPEIGCARVASVDGTSYDTFTISGSGNEVAGFWIRTGTEKIGIKTTGVGTWIHNNDVAIYSTSTTGDSAGGISCTGAGSKIERNHVFSNSGVSATILYGIYVYPAATRTLVKDNFITVTSGCTMTHGIYNASFQGLVDKNLLLECPANGGGTLAGVFTVAITCGVATLATNNRVAITTKANACETGTTDETWIENYVGTSGGTLFSDT